MTIFDALLPDGWADRPIYGDVVAHAIDTRRVHRAELRFADEDFWVEGIEAAVGFWNSVSEEAPLYAATLRAMADLEAGVAALDRSVLRPCGLPIGHAGPHRRDLPSEDGWMALPFQLHDGSGGPPWAPMVAWSYGRLLGDPEEPITDSCPDGLIATWTTWMEHDDFYTRNAIAAFDLQKEDTSDYIFEPVLLLLSAFGLFMEQGVLEPIESRPSRAVRRRGRAPTSVVVVRRRGETLHARVPTTYPVDWRQRWLVSGHWRNQFYPSLGYHKPKWIAPYVKGPADKPLVVKDRVHLVDK